MPVHAFKGFIHKFEEICSLDIETGKGMRAAEPVIVKEIAIATTEAVLLQVLQMLL